MGKFKTKVIQTGLGIFRHDQTYSGIIHTYLRIFRTLCYPEIFKTVVHPDPWHIYSIDIFSSPPKSYKQGYFDI